MQSTLDVYILRWRYRTQPPSSKQGNHILPRTGDFFLFPYLLCGLTAGPVCTSLTQKNACVAKEQQAKQGPLCRTLLYHKSALGIPAGKRILLSLLSSSGARNAQLGKSEDKDGPSASFTFVNSCSRCSCPSPARASRSSQDQPVSHHREKSLNAWSGNYLINRNPSLKQRREDSVWLTAKKQAFIFKITLKELL